MNNILISSAGRRVSLVRFFQRELKLVFPDAKVIASDASPERSAACRVADDYFAVPRISSGNYIAETLRLCLEFGIRLVIPTIDTELIILAQNVALFKMNGIDIVISDADVVQIFRDKRKTHDFFQEYGINCAKEYTRDNYELPMYLKPVDGSRSVDNFIIREASELTPYQLSNDKLLFLEYLDHATHIEYTIDLYYDRLGNLKCFVPRKRLEVRDGEVNKAVTKRTPFMHEIWRKLQFVKGFRGCITFQVFVHRDSGALYGIEINPRFGGGYPLSYLAHANFPEWIIREYLLGETALPVFDAWEENLMMLRYDDEVLVHDYTHG